MDTDTWLNPIGKTFKRSGDDHARVNSRPSLMKPGDREYRDNIGK